jgi:hypothetical protein
MKRKRKQSKRVSGVPTDAKLVAEATLSDGTKTTLYAGKDGAIYAVRLERVTYRILGGSV